MSGSRFKIPDMSLRDAVAKAKQETKGQKGVKKSFSMLRTKETSDGSGISASYDSGISIPTDEELQVINTFTRSPKTADEVRVFNTLSCNDLEDRDLDKFPTQTVQDFASLPEPYGSVGKSFMVGHDYSKMPVGRIFAADTKVIDGTTFMTNKVYLPNTEQHKSFLENMDFGVYWAVSVGVMLEANNCSVCESPMSGGGYCFAGHVKGFWYPQGDEGDPSGWDFAEPVQEGAKGAVKAIGIMEGAKDFYELSQVFLGAQFFAGLEKSPNMKGVLKAASAKGAAPMLHLSAEEAEALPFQHVPEKVADAVGSYPTETDEEGNVKWTDENGLVYMYDPETSEVLCLGKAEETDTEEIEDGEDQSAEEGADVAHGAGAEELASGEDGRDGPSGDVHGDDDAADGDGAEVVGSDGDLTESSTEEDEDDDSETEDSEVDKQTILTALSAAKAPASLISAAAAAKDSGLSAVLRSAVAQIEEQDSKIKALTAKAGMGETYLKDVTSDAIQWYVKAHQGSDRGVSTESFEKILKACGDNVDLIKTLRDEQISLAQAKFPTAVRRSSFPTDVNERTELGEPPAPSHDNDKRVSRLHG